MDREFKLVAELLKPGNRKRDEARARIRTMLAMEALVADEVEISEKDINRIEKAIKEGSELGEVFPRLNTIARHDRGRRTRRCGPLQQEAGCFGQIRGRRRLAGAAAVRQVDLQKKFHMSASELAKKLKLSGPKAYALRSALGIDDDADCQHTFEFGKASKFPSYSDNALKKMKDALAEGLDMEKVWQEHRPGLKKKAATPEAKAMLPKAAGPVPA